jgi:multidrug resistance efflux pump
VEPAAIVGEVESLRANVLSTEAGTVQELKVDLLQPVKKGEVVAVVRVTDPDVLAAELGVAEADLRLMKARMDLDRTRNLETYSRLRLDLQVEQFSLELARIRLTQAESEFARAEKLLALQIGTRGTTEARNDFGYEVAVRDRDVYRTEVAARERTVSEHQTALHKMEEAGAATIAPVDTVIEQAIQAQRRNLERLQRPIELRSPLDGFVSDVDIREGEKVPAGIPILVVSASTSDRIHAWVRQPITTRPEVGDVVQVRRIAMGERLYEATVVKVGEQLETINPALLLPNRNPERLEVGLPLLVQSPDVRDLIPGEAVQLRWIRLGNAP